MPRWWSANSTRVAQPLETLALVAERRLAVLAALSVEPDDVAYHLVGARHQRLCIRDEERCIGPTALGEEIASCGIEVVDRHPPLVTLDGQPGEVVHALDPVASGLPVGRSAGSDGR